MAVFRIDKTNLSRAKLIMSTEPKFVLRDDHGGSFIERTLVIFRHLHSLVIVGCV